MDEQPQDEVPASGTLEGTTTNAPQQNDQNAFGQNVVYVRQKSQIPKVFGALMMIYGVIVGLIGILGVFGTGGVISDYENAGIDIRTPDCLVLHLCNRQWTHCFRSRGIRRV